MADGTSEVVRAHGNVRGTQSFVHVMSAIFKRPDLVGLEIVWRFVAWLPILYVGFEAIRHTINGDLLGEGTFLTGMVPGILRYFATLLWWRAVAGFLSFCGNLGNLFCFVFWVSVCGFMRSLILRRFDSRLFPRRATTTGLVALRVAGFLLFLFAWGWMLGRIWGSIIRRADPAYVPGFALAVTGTLVLFVMWNMTSWLFPLATTLAMTKNLSMLQSLRAALASSMLRMKFIEINFVMGIVKVALLVLAMVFSACPLPFSNIATQEFLNWWWFGCFLFWVLASDYFHVVRAAAYLRLWQAYEPEISPATSPDVNPAS